MSSRQENCAYGLLSENRHHKTAVSSSFTMIWFDVSNSWLKQKAMKNWITKIRKTDFIFVFWFFEPRKSACFCPFVILSFDFSYLGYQNIPGPRILGHCVWVGLEFRIFCWVWKGLKFGFFQISEQGSKFILTTYIIIRIMKC